MTFDRREAAPPGLRHSSLTWKVGEKREPIKKRRAEPVVFCGLSEAPRKGGRPVKVVVERSKCIGAANCVGMAPKTFQLDAANKATVKDPTAHDSGVLFEAAESCPTEAVLLYDEETGEKLFP